MSGVGEKAILLIKDQVRQRDGYCCTKCGVTNEHHLALTSAQLDVHRIVPGSPYAVDGCVTLCRACHGPAPRRNRGKRFTQDEARGGAEVFSFKANAELATAFYAFLRSVKPRAQKTVCLRYALERLLEEEGYWPPKTQN